MGNFHYILVLYWPRIDSRIADLERPPIEKMLACMMAVLICAMQKYGGEFSTWMSSRKNSGLKTYAQIVVYTFPCLSSIETISFKAHPNLIGESLLS